jgi:superfamily II DNA/RNA helicase
MAEMNKDFAKARLDRMSGKVDAEVMKRISPSSFEGVPEDEHESVAKDLQQSLGILKNAATQRVIDQHPNGAKLDEIVKQANSRKGKPGIIFARNLAVVEQIKSRLEAEGHRVVSLTGADSAQDKDKKRLLFNPESGDRKADIMVLSDAGATGLNLQNGSWCLQHDTPMTAMTHAQRQGRVNRIGQRNNVELIDLVADHESEVKARNRLSKKYALRELLTSPMEGLDDTGVAYHIAQRQSQHDLY